MCFIDGVGSLQRFLKNLKIYYLQNNFIGRIKNLKRDLKLTWEWTETKHLCWWIQIFSHVWIFFKKHLDTAIKNSWLIF